MHTVNVRRSLAAIAVFLGLALVMTACVANDNNGTAKHRTNVVDLSLLKNVDDQYQYNALEWGTDIEHVTKQLPYEIASEKTMATENGTEIAIYKSKLGIALDEKEAAATFEFQNGKLQIVKFDFELSNSDEAWFTAQVDKLKELYGEPNDTLDKQNGKMSSKGYKWVASETMLQIILVSGSSPKSAAMIGVGSTAVG